MKTPRSRARRPSDRPRVRACGPAAALVLALGLPAATAQEVPPASAVDVVDVVLVNVEVWVEDRKGRPIQGLSADAFEVFEDGRPVEITHLAEVRAAPDGAAADGASPASPRSPAAPAATAPAAEGEDPAHLVIYFDQMHMSAASARRVAGDVRDFLASGRVPASRVAILRQEFDLETEAAFGSTPEQLDAALVRIAESQPVAGGLRDAQLALARMQQAWELAKNSPRPCRIMVRQTQSELATRIPELQRHFTVTLGNLHATVRFLAGLPGVKMLVLATDALELDPGSDLLLFAQNVCPNERELSELSLLGDSTSLRRALLDFTRSANANRVTFYPLQASGLVVSSVLGAENAALQQDARRGVDARLRSVQQGGLLSLAKETGGVATLNRNSFLESLEQVASDMGSYYSLAYVPPHAGDGKNHTIEVRVDVPRARVRHRLGYRDKSPAEVRDERLDGAIAFGLMDNPLAVRLAAGTVERAADGEYHLPLHLLVPSGNLVFLPGAGGDRAEVEVVVRASDARSGKRVEVERIFRPERPADAAADCDLPLSLTLPEGVYVVGVALRDMATGETSVVSTTLAIHDPDRQADALRRAPRSAAPGVRTATLPRPRR